MEYSFSICFLWVLLPLRVGWGLFRVLGPQLGSFQIGALLDGLLAAGVLDGLLGFYSGQLGHGFEEAGFFCSVWTPLASASCFVCYWSFFRFAGFVFLAIGFQSFFFIFLLDFWSSSVVSSSKGSSSVILFSSKGCFLVFLFGDYVFLKLPWSLWVSVRNVFWLYFLGHQAIICWASLDSSGLFGAPCPISFGAVSGTLEGLLFGPLLDKFIGLLWASFWIFYKGLLGWNLLDLLGFSTGQLGTYLAQSSGFPLGLFPVCSHYFQVGLLDS
ncbi:Hypothetical predicted protein [Olea europaea subsp. europaea]|uniref:Uncharacterized protein n=1 Tax=Olea europaea subsp. europaea TaxID=158383 RepID=A0A8S0RS46_OLEEU|nr:Hypothetical predicted protein [Olea europaea subsp. europaea]